MRYRRRELPECVEHALRLQCNEALEPLVMKLRAGTDGGAVFPRTGSFGIERAARTEFSLDQGFDRRAQILVVRWGKRCENTLEPGRIGLRPSGIVIVAEAESRDVRIAARAENSQPVDAVVDPAAKTERLQQ